MKNLQVILLLARLVGFNSYLYQETKDGFVATLSRSGICLYAVNMLTYVYFAIENVRNPKVYTYTGSDIVDNGGKILLGIGFCDMILILAERFYRRQWTAELLNAFRSIDKQLDALGGRPTHTLHRREVLYQMLLLACCTFGAMGYSVYAILRENLNYNVPMFIGHLMVGAAVGVIIAISNTEVYELRLRLIDLNTQISNNLCDDNFRNLQTAVGRQIIKIGTKNEDNYRTDQVARMGLIYDELHSISTKISERYKFMFSGYCILNVLYGIMAIYTFYRAIFVAGYEKRYSISIFLVWDLIFKLSLLQSVINCQFLQSEGKQTAVTVSYAISQETDKLCIKKMHSFLCQIRHNAIKATTYAFDINLGTFFAILGTNITYLFILLQFAG